jgi:hypothetical protein
MAAAQFCMSSGLIDVLARQAIQALADARTFARGTANFHGGAVGLLGANEYEARASVQGTQRYRVRLAVGSGEELDYECDCPVGDAGSFCKHAGGEPGLARHRQLVEAAWKQLPALGSNDFRTHFDSNRHRIEHAMEELGALSEATGALRR